MNWKNLLESLSESVNDHLRLRNDYLVAENRILRHQIDGRVQLIDSERQELAELGTKWGKKALAEIATVAKADTILAWNRQYADQKVDTSESLRPGGRPRIGKEIEDLVIRMAQENRSWGYDRIQGAVKHLGYTISDQTVGNILKRHSISPAPERKKTVTWREFVRIHMDVLSATDFWTSAGWSWGGLGISLLLFFLSRGRCQGDVPLRMTQLRQLMREWIQSQSHKVKVHLQRWPHLVEERVWLRPIGCDERVRRASPHEVIPHGCHELLPQGRGTVVVLRAACPHPIRDGPRRGQRWPGGRLAYSDREAA
jgi:hypothetical protein